MDAVNFVMIYILPFVVLLGILVTVHEAGHFLVAKYFGIKVEKFSIGFGPRIFGKTIGDTEYRVSWIPLGGYVKMAGDDPTDDEAREVPGSFMGAILWKRMLVVFAGPAVNLVLPIFIIAGVYMYGRHVPAAYAGLVGAGTPAAEAGIEAGDLVVEVAGQPVQTWDEMTGLIRTSESPIDVVVERDGRRIPFSITPEIKEVPDLFRIKRPTPLIGVGQRGLAAIVDPVPGTPAEKAGLQTGDRIVSIGGREITDSDDLEAAVNGLEPGVTEVVVKRHPLLPFEPDARRKAQKQPPETVTLSMEVPEGAESDAIGMRQGDLVIAQVESDSPAEAAGLQAGDRLVGANGTTFGNAFDYNGWLQEAAGSKSVLTIVRENQDLEISLTPTTREEKIRGTSRTEEFAWVGLDLHAKTAPLKTVKIQYKNPLTALAAGVRGTGESIMMNVTAFGKIFAGEIPLRESLGGPIAIAEVTGVAYEDAGYGGFIQVLIHMSVILGIMNLLPIPVLDGGHLAFFTIEAVMRRPPSVRVREFAQHAGLLLLLALMAFVLVNDVVTRI